MTYYYYISYDEDKDEFWGLVDADIDDKNSEPIFFIDNLEEIVDYLNTGVMSHVDDAKGLEVFLKKQGILKPEDDLVLSLEPLH